MVEIFHLDFLCFQLNALLVFTIKVLIVLKTKIYNRLQIKTTKPNLVKFLSDQMTATSYKINEIGFSRRKV